MRSDKSLTNLIFNENIFAAVDSADKIDLTTQYEKTYSYTYFIFCSFFYIFF